MKRWIDLFYVVEHMSLRYEKIFPSIVVEILQANTPPRTSAGEHTEAGLQAPIAEGAFALVVIDAINFAGELGDDHIGASVIVVVLKNHAHSGESSPIFRQSGSSLKSAFRKGAITVVMVEVLLHAVVGDEYVSEAVAIVIGEGHAQGTAFLSRDTGFLADVCKSSVAIIVIENAGGGGKFLRRTICVPVSAAGFAVLRVPFHVAGDEQVQPAIIVVVEKSR